MSDLNLRSNNAPVWQFESLIRQLIKKLTSSINTLNSVQNCCPTKGVSLFCFLGRPFIIKQVLFNSVSFISIDVCYTFLCYIQVHVIFIFILFSECEEYFCSSVRLIKVVILFWSWNFKRGQNYLFEN